MSRFVFVTGHVFGCRALEGILSSSSMTRGELDPVLVIGLSPRRHDSTVGYQSPMLHARQAGTQYLETANGRLTDLSLQIRASAPDYILVIGWSSLIPQQVADLAKSKILGQSGAIGMHPTKLPIGRGRAPIPWTILRGIEESALSVFILQHQPDAGPLLAQYPLSVSASETSGSLFWKFADLHYHAGRAIAASLASHQWTPEVQDESVATSWTKRTPDDGRIDSGMSTQQVSILVRAQQAPYPPAWISLGGQRVAVGRMSASEPEPSEPWLRFRVRDGQVWLMPLGAEPAPLG